MSIKSTLSQKKAASPSGYSSFFDNKQSLQELGALPPTLQLSSEYPVQRDEDEDSNDSENTNEVEPGFDFSNFTLRRPPFRFADFLRARGTDTRDQDHNRPFSILPFNTRREANSTFSFGSDERNLSYRREFTNNSNRFNLNYDGFRAGLGTNSDGNLNRLNLGYQGDNFGMEGNVNPMTGAFGLDAGLQNLDWRLFNNRIILEKLGLNFGFDPNDRRRPNSPSFFGGLTLGGRFGRGS